jgi:hypothetical protein
VTNNNNKLKLKKMITKEELRKMVLRYLNETSKHLFKVDGTNTIIKILPFEKDGKLYYVEIVTGDKFIATINHTPIDYVHVMKHSIFPDNYKTIAIKKKYSYDDVYDIVMDKVKSLDFKKINETPWRGHVIYN